MRAEPDPDVDTVGDDRLQRLGAALRVEEHEAVLLEEALGLAGLSNALLPAAALPDGDLQGVLRGRVATKAYCNECRIQHATHHGHHHCAPAPSCSAIQSPVSGRNL